MPLHSHRRPKVLASVACALVLAHSGACRTAADGTDASALVELQTPAGPNSGEPFLSTDANGTVHFSWLERTGDSTWALRYARLTDDSWSPARTIAERRDFFVNWADFPSVQASPDGSLYAHWLQRSDGGKYSYDAMVALSSDSGRSWGDARVLHRDGVAAEHGFVAMWPGEGGGMEAAWLDGRNTISADRTARAMQVATTHIGHDGALGTEQILDRRNCDCCQVAATLTARGPVVAYRDRTADEVRDIAVVRRVNGQWTEPRTVHDDGWHIEACPVNGPALASRGDTVVVAWFTGARDTSRVQVAYSADAGASFGTPHRIDAGNPAGRVDVELLDDGSAAVSWLERTDSTTAEVRVRRVRRDGSAGAPVVLARSTGARASGFPRITRHGEHLVAAWTVPGDTARVHVARYRIDALP